MSSDTAHFVSLLDRRTDLLELLIRSLQSARDAIIKFDMRELEAGIAEQQDLCARIRMLDADIEKFQASRDHADPRVSGAFERMIAAASLTHQLNHAQRSLLRHSRRTVDALMNSYRMFALTYADPCATGGITGERV
jgi:chromosome segregation ATPase